MEAMSWQYRNVMAVKTRAMFSRVLTCGGMCFGADGNNPA
jgi:hypothetical protein